MASAEKPGSENDFFSQIALLNVGEGFLFSPSAMLGYEKETGKSGEMELKTRKLGIEYLKVRMRGRVTYDGGKSVLAV